ASPTGYRQMPDGRSRRGSHHNGERRTPPGNDSTASGESPSIARERSGALDRAGILAPALAVISSGADIVIAEIQIRNTGFDPNRCTADHFATVIALDAITRFEVFFRHPDRSEAS